MTGPIGHAASTQVPPEAPAPTAVRPPVNAAPAATETPAQEAVTLSANAQATTQLFQAARESDGVDQANVQRIRVALQNGTYDVAPETMAAAMTAALKERS